MRKEFCEKDGILITYTENDVCFEDCKTAEAILLNNDGSIIHSNFNDEKNKYFQRIKYRFNIFIFDYSRNSLKYICICIIIFS